MIYWNGYQNRNMVHPVFSIRDEHYITGELIVVLKENYIDYTPKIDIINAINISLEDVKLFRYYLYNEKVDSKGYRSSGIKSYTTCIIFSSPDDAMMFRLSMGEIITEIKEVGKFKIESYDNKLISDKMLSKWRKK